MSRLPFYFTSLALPTLRGPLTLFLIPFRKQQQEEASAAGQDLPLARLRKDSLALSVKLSKTSSALHSIQSNVIRLQERLQVELTEYERQCTHYLQKGEQQEKDKEEVLAAKIEMLMKVIAELQLIIERQPAEETNREDGKDTASVGGRAGKFASIKESSLMGMQIEGDHKKTVKAEEKGMSSSIVNNNMAREQEWQAAKLQVWVFSLSTTTVTIIHYREKPRQCNS